MNLGVPIAAGPGSGSIPVGMSSGVHPASLSQGPGSGIGISSSSSLGGSGMGGGTGAVGGTMPPVGLDFVKVSLLVTLLFLGSYVLFLFSFWIKKCAYIQPYFSQSLFFLLHNFS